MDLDKLLRSRILLTAALLAGSFAGLAKVFKFLVPPGLQPYLTILIVIVAIYFLAAALQILYKNLRSGPGLEAAQALPPAEQAYTYFATRYGIGYDSIQVLWTIHKNGSATLQRTIEIDAFSKIENLDTYLLIPESSEERQIAFVDIKSLTAGRTVTLSDIKKELGRLSALTTISPPLNRGEKIQYRMRERLPEGLYAIDLTSEELAAREEGFDYCGWNINRPTRKISLQVEFPPFFRPAIFSSEVRYASASGFASVRTHYEEEQISTPELILSAAGDRFLLTLEVDYPMLGLIYILRWRPVAREDGVTPNEAMTAAEAKQPYLAAIRNILIERFDVGELRTLSADLGLDYDNLPGQGKANKARELVSYFERRDQVAKLVAVGQQQRPDIVWPAKPGSSA